LLLTLIVSRFRSRRELMGRCLTPFRVLPTDLDTALHVNNGVYLSLLDLARVDFLMRSGCAATLMRNRWFPVVAAETIQFHRELRLFERFFAETQLLGWDDRTFFIRHRIFKKRPDGDLAAEAVIRGIMVRRSGGTVSIPELIAAVGNPPRPEAMPDWIVDWAKAMDDNRARLKQR
jgi:acyl-CoA thioesterase FadM